MDDNDRGDLKILKVIAFFEQGNAKRENSKTKTHPLIEIYINPN